MIILYMFLGVIIFIGFIKVFGRKIEDEEISGRGGIKIIFAEYFNSFDSNLYGLSYEGFGFDEVNGSKARYHIFSTEYQFQVNFESYIIKDVMFTKYKIYKSEIGGLKLYYSSPKYNFTNAEYKQLEMYEAIIQRSFADILTLII